MTTHSLTCTHCGHRIQSDSLEDLVSIKRSCPLCGKSSWELLEFDSFPCSIRERKIMYQKILQIMKWCMDEKPCENNRDCPLQKYCVNGDIVGAFVAWLKEAEI